MMRCLIFFSLLSKNKMNILVVFLLYACIVVFCSLSLYSSTKIKKKFSLDCQNDLDAILLSGNQQAYNDYIDSLESKDPIIVSQCMQHTYLECNGTEQYPKIYINIVEPFNWTIPPADLPNENNEYLIDPMIIDVYTNLMSFQCQVSP